jgi:hypothetical protein
MSRILWLALFCLAALGCLSVIRFTIGRGQAVSLPSVASEVVDMGKTLSKGDRLPFQATPRENFEPGFVEIDKRREAGLLALKAAAAAALLTNESAADDVVSWHWREGAKIVRKRRPP